MSIVMPAYNAARYIVDAVRSVQEQTFKDWELIVVDDGSTDDTWKLLRSFRDSRIRLQRQTNQGVSSARNLGLENSKGRYIAFMDADDVLPARSLESRVALLDEQPDVDIVDGIVSFRDASLENELRAHVPGYRGPLFPRLKRLDSKVFSSVVFMFRAELARNVRFERDMTHSEDLMFFLRLSSASDAQYAFVLEPVYWYRTGHASAIQNLEGWERGYLEVLRRIRDIPQMSRYDHFRLRIRISAIIFRTWMSRRQPARAIRSAWKALAPKDL